MPRNWTIGDYVRVINPTSLFFGQVFRVYGLCICGWSLVGIAHINAQEEELERYDW